MLSYAKMVLGDACGVTHLFNTLEEDQSSLQQFDNCFVERPVRHLNDVYFLSNYFIILSINLCSVFTFIQYLCLHDNLKFYNSILA